jgi:FixJ family two-component response regulator
MNETKSVTKQIVIVDDDPDIRAAMVAWLANDYEVLSFDGAESVIKAMSTGQLVFLPRSCLLIDVQMTGMSGLKLLEHLRRLAPDANVILMSGVARQDQIIKAWRDGAKDFLLKPFDIAELNTALERCFSEQEMALATKSPELAYAKVLLQDLSPREAGVLLLLAEGHKQQDVADALGIALRTVKKHRANISLKLGLDNLADLVRFCDEHRSEIVMLRDKPGGD